MLLNPCNVHTPKTLEELKGLYASLENVRLQAGGTFLLNALKLLKRNGAKTPEHIISLNKVEGLKGIEQTTNGLLIRAMTTIDELFNADLKEHFTVLRTVCKNISTQPIRNMATVGGNLTCRYTWTEMPAVMIGLRATMHFIDKNGASSLPAEEFYKNNAKTDKILTHVELAHDAKAAVGYQRVKKSQFVDIPLLSLIVNTRWTNGAFSETVVAVNNCVDFAQRDKKLEAFLNGKKSDAKTMKQALENLTDEIYDRRAGDYKKHMFRVSLRKALEEIAGKTS
jgi:CO/xanthine dehydrogenase FAD-binding subunit